MPERVWIPKSGTDLDQQRTGNGGYRYVLLNDRLLYPHQCSYAGSPRERFDSTDRSTRAPAGPISTLNRYG